MDDFDIGLCRLVDAITMTMTGGEVPSSCCRKAFASLLVPCGLGDRSYRKSMDSVIDSASSGASPAPAATPLTAPERTATVVLTKLGPQPTLICWAAAL